jgi:hypothetical protein
MSTGSIHYAKQRHGACPFCQQDFEDAEAGELVCGYVVCEECLVALADVAPHPEILWCPQCQTSINRDQIRRARHTTPESERRRIELEEMTWNTFNSMEASLVLNPIEDEQEISERAMDEPAESAR